MPDDAASPFLSNPNADFDAVIVGAGVAGLYAIYRLRKLGLRVRAYETGDGVGGTWFWNRYPGCRCDVESLEYSFSFDEDLQQEWEWPERYGTQPEILKYVHHVVERFDLMRDVQLNTRITAAEFDEDTLLWTLTTAAGEQVTAPVCIMAAGNLSTPRRPAYPGLDAFEGKSYHTGLWPKDGVDFTGLKVGVVGTGSSGVQSIPHIAAQAAQLTVFQRTANFILPARNRPHDPETVRQHKAAYAERRQAAYDTPFGIAGYPPPTKKALEAASEERRAQYEAKWQEGGSISFLFSYTDLLQDIDANETAAEFVREKIRRTVKDPVTAERLCPDNHPIGTKRLILDTNYFETYNEPHVSLVDLRKTPIETITRSGIRTTEADFELDAIVFATGFDAMTGAMLAIDIRVKDGVTLEEQWTGGPRTYLGLMVAGLPNLFMVTGPQSPGVKSQMILSIEMHVDWIADCLERMRRDGQNRIVPTAKAQEDWVNHVREVADATLYPQANSWYMGANIPGKPRVFMPYVGGVHTYKKACDDVVAKGYEGFVMTGEKVGA